MMSLAARNQIQVKLAQIYTRSTLENPIVECLANLLSLAGGALTESVLKKVASLSNVGQVEKLISPMLISPIKNEKSERKTSGETSDDYTSGEGSSGSEDQIRIFRGIWNDVRGDSEVKPVSLKDPDNGGGRTPSRKAFAMEGLAVAGPENLTTFVPYPRLCGATFSQTGISFRAA
jgi:hypothetical protein